MLINRRRSYLLRRLFLLIPRYRFLIVRQHHLLLLRLLFSFSGDIASSSSRDFFLILWDRVHADTAFFYSGDDTASLLFPSPHPTPTLSLLTTLQLQGRTMWLLVWSFRWTKPPHTVVAASEHKYRQCVFTFSRDVPWCYREWALLCPKISWWYRQDGATSGHRRKANKETNRTWGLI